MSDTINQMRRVFDQALAVAERKNADYGDAWRDQGWRGNISRIFEKTKRLRTLLWSGRPVDPQVSENVEETALDMVNTLVFFILNKQAGVEWGHETPFDFMAYTGVSHAQSMEMPLPSTVAAIHDGLEAATVTERLPAVNGEVLPVRDPGVSLGEAAETEVAEDEAPTGNRRKPSPGRRMPQRS